MRKSLGIISLVVLLGTICLFGGCISKKTFLTISITSDPQGGWSTSSLSCSFRGYLEARGGLFGGVHPITATVEWWWENYYHQNSQKMKSKTYTFSTKGTTTRTTTYSAASGYVLLNYWWVKIKWTDEDGNSYTIQSNKAYCYYTSSISEKTKKEVTFSLPTRDGTS